MLLLQQWTLIRLNIEKVVLPPGNAPGSADYRSAALLLSYGRKEEMVAMEGFAPPTSKR